MLKLGDWNNLEIIKRVPFGFYLKQGSLEILLPTKYTNDSMKVGDFIDVVIYTDSNDRLIATTLTPKVLVNTFASLRVEDVNPIGAFVDIGLEKHLLVPKSMQVSNLIVGKNYIFYVYADKLTNRLIATEKIDKYLETEHIDLQLNEEVELLTYKATPLGYKVVVNNMYCGMLYHNEIFEPISVGYAARGYVKQIREDGKLDITLQSQGIDNLLDAQEKIISKLKSAKGYLNLNDTTDATEIKNALQMSKKSFKRAIGMLYKEQRIVFEGEGIRLVEK